MEYKKIIEKKKKFLFFDLEKAILNNLTRISFYLILLFSTLQLLFFVIWKNFLETKDFITLLWAILAFWYWYKKYERDKELEIIDKYAKKYNDINNKLYFLKIKFENEDKNIELKEEIKRSYIDLINLFYEEFYLKSNWYISDRLWNEWSEWIELDISDFLSYSIYKLFSFEDSDIFIWLVLWNYLQQYNKNINIKNDWFTYLEYIIEIFNKIQRDFKIELKNKIFNNKQSEFTEKMEDLVDWIDAINITLANEKNKLEKFEKLRNLTTN